MKVTFLGTGSSLGVPIIGCNCDVCKSSDTRDKRMRSSVLVEIDNKKIVIDAGPDFRNQMLLFNQSVQLDAILITHSHRDHIGGLDDIRPFNFLLKKNIPLFANKETINEIYQLFSYSFGQNSNGGIPRFDIFEIDNKEFFFQNIKIIPVQIFHNKPILGFRIGDIAYLTDIKSIDDKEKLKLKNVKILVLSALRLLEHSYHFSLQNALDLVKEIAPQQAYLTHLGHSLGTYSKLSTNLPQNVFVAYDGLQIEI